MKTAVVYYSMNGNTEYVANEVAEKLGADLLRLVPVKAYPTEGFLKFMWGGMSAVMAKTPKLEPYDFDAAAYDCIVIGFPVWAATVTPPIRTFIKENDLDGKCIAAFACMAGSGAEDALGKLKEALGIESFEAELVLISPKEQPTEENEAKIAEFCAALSC